MKDSEAMTEANMKPFEQPLVLSPEEEFRQFCEGRLEGLELTEEDSALETYRLAMELGLKKLKGENNEEVES